MAIEKISEHAAPDLRHEQAVAHTQALRIPVASRLPGCRKGAAVGPQRVAPRRWHSFSRLKATRAATFRKHRRAYAGGNSERGKPAKDTHVDCADTLSALWAFEGDSTLELKDQPSA